MKQINKHRRPAKRKPWFSRLLFSAAMLLVLSPASSFADHNVIDQTGRKISIPDKISRVVALAPSTTEIIYALNKESLLQGVTQFSDYPKEAKKLPQVGSYVRLDLERIVSLEPDLCIAVKDGNPLATILRLVEFGIPVYAIDVKDTASVIQSIRNVGDLLSAEERANEIADMMENRISEIRNTITQVKYRPRVFMQIAIDPIVSGGSNTFSNELIQLAGGINLAEGPTVYPRYSREQIITMNPEVFIITSMTDMEAVKGVIKEWQVWPQVSAVKNKRIHLINSDIVNRPGPRLIQGLEELARIIHPELFPIDK